MTLYPDLTKEKIIALDCETHDPNLVEYGSGVYRDDGRILGVSIATKDGFNAYYNLGHKDCTHELRTKNYNYLKEQLATDVPKVGANIQYDLDWLCNSKHYNFKVGGKYHDAQVAEPLLNEYALSYSLDTLGLQYLGKGKSVSKPERFCYRNGLTGDFRQHLHLMPYYEVEEYAKQDTALLIPILEKQLERLGTKVLGYDLLGLYDMEISLIPLLLQMRKNGIRIDIEKAYENRAILAKKLQVKQHCFWDKYGDINYNSTSQLVRIFNKLNIPTGRTAPTKTKPNGGVSVDAKVLGLNAAAHSICSDILDLRSLERVVNTVFDKDFFDSKINVNGRIHTTFALLKATDDFTGSSRGTITGRLSSFTPNLQQISAKKDKYPKESRECFICEEGMGMGKIDASQVEYRIFSHYASGAPGEALRKAYNENPDTDFHDMTVQKTGLDRKIAKNLNFGLMYGMGKKRCAENFYWTYEDANKYVKLYHNENPALKLTMKEVEQVARGRGFIRTILGRIERVDDEIRTKHLYYKMLNKLIQGSAADHLKKTMSDCYKEGIFNILVPHLTVHDELVVSYPKTKEGHQALLDMKNIMENCIKLKVPIKAELEVGNNWYDVKGNKRERIEDFYEKVKS